MDGSISRYWWFVDELTTLLKVVNIFLIIARLDFR